MPQMAPLSWLGLFIIFSLTLILFNAMNYFLFSPQVPSSSIAGFKTNPLPWKW